MIHLKTPDEIAAIARGGAILAALFRELGPRVVPGASTGEIDDFCEAFIRSHDGAEPAFKGLYGFPGSVCASLNEEIVHGIPSPERTVREGDLLSIDVGVRLDGWCSDSAWTYAVGEVDEASRTLLEVTRRALDAAVSAAVPGRHVGDIGAAVMRTVEGTGLHIIRDLVGHGVGRDVHEEPQVPNYGRPGMGPLLREGMVIAIEPMLAWGSDRIRTLDDGWTVVTADGSRSAHFEHTVAITREGPQVLTALPQDAGAGDLPAATAGRGAEGGGSGAARGGSA
ncbi:MAG: type I methionyl aminopeptidase [Gemmatimonadetes bacterium]|nr:MAG: type I methionyl aminopeptidase [Gemmatimonadota bacterium]